MTDVLAEKLGDATAAMAEVLVHGSFAPALKDNHDLIHKSVGVNFAAAAAPKGNAWPPRKKIGDDHPLLIDTTKLFQAATSDFGEGAVNEVGDREAATGVDPGEVPYAATHNFGDPDRNMPQREFEDVDDATLDRMAERIADRGIELLI
jgi:phage gpG-like protein